MRVEEVAEVSDDLAEAIARLIGQLSSKYAPPTVAELEEIVASPGTKLLVARDDDGAIVGTLTLALYRIPTALCAWIEDVVVDEQARGRGVGEALNREAVRIAEDSGAQKIDLTSRPDREAAHRLYERLGFRRRDTSVYRYGG